MPGVSVRKLIILCVPSQYGLMAEAPHLQRATVLRRRTTGSPEGVTTSKSPRTRMGPSGQRMSEALSGRLSSFMSLPIWVRGEGGADLALMLEP
jgi:hypothetical protein